jgi:hypothetical protein
MGKLGIGSAMALLGIALLALALIRLGVRVADGFSLGALGLGQVFDPHAAGWGSHVLDVAALFGGLLLLAGAGVLVFLGLRRAD